MDVLGAPRCSHCGASMERLPGSIGTQPGYVEFQCSAFPLCQGTAFVPVDEVVLDEPEPSKFEDAVPLTLSAAPREPHLQTRFYQATGLPESIVERIDDVQLDRKITRSAAQWRLDFPVSRAGAVDQALRPIIAVAEAILTRGAITYCSPETESLLQPRRQAPEIRELKMALLDVGTNPTSNFEALTFDSDEEQLFYNRLQSWLSQESHSWHILPQVHLASLTPHISGTNERSDFLLTHPLQNPVLVEIDGQQHNESKTTDGAVGTLLKNNGVRVFRVPVDEVRKWEGPKLRQLLTQLKTTQKPSSGSSLASVIRLGKFVHQIELALLEAVRGGWLVFGKRWAIGIQLPLLLRNSDEARKLATHAVTDFLCLVEQLGILYQTPLPSTDFHVAIADQDAGAGQVDAYIGPASVSPDEIPEFLETAPRFLISDICFPADIAAPLNGTSPVTIEQPPRSSAEWFLKYMFRKCKFRHGQWQTIERTLQGKDSLVLLPTGAGKSIAFQLAAILLPGRCLVVDPIIALIEDQVENLRRAGIDRCVGITSRIIDPELRKRILRAFSRGQYLFTYVTPERFQIDSFRDALLSITQRLPISLVAVDEAHCVSEWGHDFRTAYLNLGRNARDYAGTVNGGPPLLGLTGTASRIVLKDVQRELGILDFDAIITPHTFDRPELTFDVRWCESRRKQAAVTGLLASLPDHFGVAPERFFQPNGAATYSGLIFCPHVGGDYGIERYAKHLSQHLGIRVDQYGGRKIVEIKEAAQRFKRNQTALMACTKAFGMGIDKPNIRYTVHIGLPPSIEAFYQEAGRAGRANSDDNNARCVIVVSNDYPRKNQSLLAPNTEFETIAAAVDKTKYNDQDDVMRALWFHVQSFRGEEAELDDVRTILRICGDLSSEREVRVSWKGYKSSRAALGIKERYEKAVHRLVLLGVVRDYTIDYSSEQFTLRLSGATQEEIARAFGKYVGAYQQALRPQMEQRAQGHFQKNHTRYVFEVSRLLVEFTYEHVEKARRSALSEMLQTANAALRGEDFRERLLNHLQASEFDLKIREVTDASSGGLDLVPQILEGVDWSADAAELRGAVARVLSSYPDIPGLLLLRGASEAMVPNGDPEVARQNIAAAIKFALTDFGLNEIALARTSAYIINKVAANERAIDDVLAAFHESGPQGRAYYRELMRNLPLELADTTAQRLNGQLAHRLTKVWVD